MTYENTTACFIVLRWRWRFAHTVSAHQKIFSIRIEHLHFHSLSLSVFLFILVRFGFNVNLHNLLSVTQSMYVINYQLIAIQWSFCSTTCDDDVQSERSVSDTVNSLTHFPGSQLGGQFMVKLRSLQISGFRKCLQKRCVRVEFAFIFSRNLRKYV